MKVALLFFGQPRFIDNPEIERVYKETILNRYDTDVFCHTWWEEADKEYDYSSWSRISKCPIPQNALELICEKYNPLLLQHNAPETFTLPPNAKMFVDAKFTGQHPEGHWNEKNYSNIMSQLRSIKYVADLFDAYRQSPEVNQSYDWIILARYDTIVVNFPNLEMCDTSKFYLPGHHPRFPDTIQFFGTKYLGWAKNAFNDVDSVYQDIWEPSPEAFKMGSFLRRYSHSDLAPCPMDAHAVRG
ncbi:hypothetical protein [Synechococcus phage DSL-LC03]|nr:hypothetical protein [Synechococcus phage DSL-LC03]